MILRALSVVGVVAFVVIAWIIQGRMEKRAMKNWRKP